MEENEKFRILVIEDSESVRKEFEAYLEVQPDVEAVWCVGGIGDGIRILFGEKPTTIILDWMLGDNVEGDEFLKEAARLGANRPIIFVISNTSSEITRQSVTNTGLVETFLTKNSENFGPPMVMQKIRRYTHRLFDTSCMVVRENPVHKESEISASLTELERFTCKTLLRQIEGILKVIGLTPHTKSFRTTTQVLLHACVTCYQKGSDSVIDLGQDIYSRVYHFDKVGCKRGKANPEAVRSNLRSAVEKIYAKTDTETFKKYCPYLGDSDGNLEVKNFVMNFASGFVDENRTRFPVVDYLNEVERIE